MGAPDAERGHRDARVCRESSDARLGSHRLEVVGDGSLGVDAHAFTRGKRRRGGAEGSAGGRAVPRDGDLTGSNEEEPTEARIPELGLRHEPDLAAPTITE